MCLFVFVCKNLRRSKGGRAPPFDSETVFEAEKFQCVERAMAPHPAVVSASLLWFPPSVEMAQPLNSSPTSRRSRSVIVKNAMHTDDSDSYTGIKDTYSTPGCTVRLAQGRVTGLKDVSPDSKA